MQSAVIAVEDVDERVVGRMGWHQAELLFKHAQVITLHLYHHRIISGHALFDIFCERMHQANQKSPELSGFGIYA